MLRRASNMSKLSKVMPICISANQLFRWSSLFVEVPVSPSKSWVRRNPSFPDRMTGGSRGTPPGIRTEHLVVQYNGNRSGEGKGGLEGLERWPRWRGMKWGRRVAAGYYHDKSSPSRFLPGYPGAWDRNSGGPVADRRAVRITPAASQYSSSRSR